MTEPNPMPSVPFGGACGWPQVCAGILWLALVGALAILILSFPRVLEGTDEASWILCAGNPKASPGWGIFFGYALHPLWIAGQGDVAGFRLAGLVALTSACLIFLQAFSQAMRAEGGEGCWKTWKWGVAASLLLAGFSRYTVGTRTPGYDWVVFLGSLLVAAGWLWGEVNPKEKRIPWADLIGGAGLAIVGLGKWTCLPGYGVVLGGLLIWKHGFPGALLAGLRWLGSGILVLALFLGWAGWEGVQGTLSAGFAQVKTGSHALILQTYPVSALKFLWFVVRAYIWVGILAGVIWLLLRCLLRAKPNMLVVAGLTFAAGFFLALQRGLWLGGANTFGKGILITVVWLIGVFLMSRSFSVPGVPNLHRSVLLLLLLPLMNAAGTAASPMDMMSHSLVFPVAVGWIWLGRAFVQGLPAWCLASAVLMLGGLQSLRIASTTLNTSRVWSVWGELEPTFMAEGEVEPLPYALKILRQDGSLYPPLSLNQMTPGKLYQVGSSRADFTTFRTGPEKGRLATFSAQVQALEILDTDLRKGGFRPGDPILGFTDLPGLVYLLGGTSPGVCWYMGMANQDPLAGIRKNLENIPPETLRKAWVVIRANPDGPAVRWQEVWPSALGVPLPRRLEKTYDWFWWQEGRGRLDPVRVFRPASAATAD